MYSEIKQCRICGNKQLITVLDLGLQALTGVFPKSKEETIPEAPLELVKCHGVDDCCGLVQLKHTYQLSEMYGMNYGYMSSLNKSMVKHLQQKIEKVVQTVDLVPHDIVIDIGSNDATTLKAYPDTLGLRLLGVDPTGIKFKSCYPAHIDLLADFFSYGLVSKYLNGEKARVITSFSMLYDLENPLAFIEDIHQVLAEDGIWVFEQSYLPLMLNQNSFDTICHEHLEYYALHQIVWMLDRVGFSILDVELNDVNGGSFSVVCKKSSTQISHGPIVAEMLKKEQDMGLYDLKPYQAFAQRVENIRTNIRAKLSDIAKQGQVVYGLGASTKGNVLLQYCGLNEQSITAIGEVNEDKYGAYTPGSLIPIISEADMLVQKPDYLFVLPWHFRSGFERNKQLTEVQRIYPLPNLEVVE